MCGLFLVVVVLYGFNIGKFDFLGNKIKKQAGLQTEEEEKIIRTDYTEVARKTLDWIDKQRNKEGWYILEQGCDFEKKTCEMVWDKKEGNKDGLIATWVRLNFYDQYKDPKDLEIVKKDIDKFWDKYKDDDLKDSLWICKITYEMAQSKYIDKTQKDKLKKMCVNYKPRSIEEVINSWSDHNESASSYDSSIAGLTNLAYRYLWFGDGDDKDLAEKYLKLFEEVYNQDFETEKEESFFNYKRRYTDDVCLMVYSSLDWFKLVVKDNRSVIALTDKYLNFNNKLTDKNDGLTLMCGLVDKKLLEILKDKRFSINLELNNNYLIDKFKNNYDDGFFILSRKNRGVSTKNIAENALMVGLLIK